jgi:hypothetical protein
MNHPAPFFFFAFDSGNIMCYVVAHKEVAYESDTHHTNPR